MRWKPQRLSRMVCWSVDVAIFWFVLCSGYFAGAGTAGEIGAALPTGEGTAGEVDGGVPGGIAGAALGATAGPSAAGVLVAPPAGSVAAAGPPFPAGLGPVGLTAVPGRAGTSSGRNRGGAVAGIDGVAPGIAAGAVPGATGSVFSAAGLAGVAPGAVAPGGIAPGADAPAGIAPGAAGLPPAAAAVRPSFSKLGGFIRYATPRISSVVCCAARLSRPRQCASNRGAARRRHAPDESSSVDIDPHFANFQRAAASCTIRPAVSPSGLRRRRDPSRNAI